MKTEQEITARQQQNVEQQAVFLPKNAQPESGYIEIDEHDPVLFPSTDVAKSPEKNKYASPEEIEEFVLNETETVVRGFARQAVLASQFTTINAEIRAEAEAELDEEVTPEIIEQEKNKDIGVIADGLVRSIELISDALPEEKREGLALAAFEAIKEVPQDEITKELVKENRSATEVVNTLSKESRMAKTDILDVEASLRRIKADMVLQASLEIEGSPLYEFAKEQVEKINAVLRRNKPTLTDMDITPPPTPTTDELEKLFSQPSHEDVQVEVELEDTPTKEHRLRLLAKKALASVVKIVRK